MNLSQVSGTIALELMNLLWNGATLTIYSGTQPATPETALSGNTALVAWTFTSTPFGTPTFGSSKMTATGNLTSTSGSPTSNGTAVFARATLAASAWAATHAYTYGTLVSNGGNYYLCVGAGTSAGSGGPTTAAQGIADSGVTWDYIGATTGQGNVLADYTAGTSGTDIILGSTTISIGVPVTISSVTQAIPVS